MKRPPRARPGLPRRAEPIDHASYADAYIAGILGGAKTIAMVGASAGSNRPSYFAMKYLLGKGYKVIPVNPSLAGKTILGLFDTTPKDCMVTVDEIKNNSLIVSLLSPDVTVDGKMALSLGIKATAVKATYTAPNQ